jgi:glutamine---fructose-6-phosphate transaminase (isomerizing)
MEYRGYDSAGVAVLSLLADAAGAAASDSAASSSAASSISVVKRVGKVKNLESALQGITLAGTMGIGHTRWSTHGAPNDVNSHPHSSADNEVVVVHNGVIENHATIRRMLEAKGYVFVSETDTEVLAHLVHDTRHQHPELAPEDAVRKALTLITGAFGVVFMFADQPDLLVGARRGSPLILGVKDGEYLLASDASAIVEHTKHVVYLEEDTLVAVRRGGYHVSHITEKDEHGHPVIHDPEVVELELSLEKIEKGGHKHFMIKEILEQPEVLSNAMRGRIADDGTVHLGGLRPHMARIAAASRIIICACGTSLHAGMVAEYLIESMCRVPVEVEYASEFRYRTPVIREDDVVVAISQSGETADTLAAIQLAKSRKALCIGFVNVVGSTIARETDAGVYLHVGPEIGVASTKAFTGQVVALSMFALALAAEKGTLPEDELKSRGLALKSIPDLVSRALALASGVRDLSCHFRFAHSFLYLGRGYNYPVALEGALKLKEISYIHAEGLAAAEMKHGPIALIDESMPVVIMAPKTDPTYDKIVSNLQEVAARKGCLIVLTDEGNDDFDKVAEFVINVPECPEWLAPVVYVIPLQLLSYYVAALRKCGIDQPRNLAKSVTVE